MEKDTIWNQIRMSTNDEPVLDNSNLSYSNRVGCNAPLFLSPSFHFCITCHRDYRHHPNDRQVIHADVSRNDRHVCNGQDQSNGYLQAPIPEHVHTQFFQ